MRLVLESAQVVPLKLDRVGRVAHGVSARGSVIARTAESAKREGTGGAVGRTVPIQAADAEAFEGALKGGA